MRFPINRVLFTVLVFAAVSMLSAPAAFSAEGVHRVVMHLDDNDPARMNLVLNNAANVTKYYQEQGEEVEIEIVAYGPGLHMLRADTSPVKERVMGFPDNFDNVSFRACGNTHSKMSAKAGKEVELLPQADMVPSGVIQLIQRQEEGWAYVRP
jgi:intracellular sulfur oxidation DsrE/DsrF family protein